MRNATLFAMAVVLVGMAIVSSAQEPPEVPQPTQEHEWLKQFVGEWETTSKANFGPGTEPLECTGTISSRMLGGFWVVNEMKSEVSGFTVLGVQTVGYDPKKKKYIGTWVDSMANHMWHYVGSVDNTGKKLTLEAEGPSFMAEGKMTKYRDAYEFKSPDHILVTSSMLGEDGKWTTFMSGDAKRAKNEVTR